ncbi:DUF4326 domain-containing protein [Gloeobacter morelensis]|uniref:DUF4326 domain-containing protein n=1 Tax=Gloeobacter morelensis MG652769 TaxID=2781736 RepID=A0ABY3PIY9_9CYAN|nr:DUF4326 domain-containing protein [Gloeobacter morelensis]UFP93617.1 DUF4326 domain-containing protein [Gloeobacter morelensis MG652769]
MQILVTNKRYDNRPGEYIGRPSVLGNPFVLGEHGSRDEVVEKYRRWLWEQIKEEGAVYRELLRLKAAAQKRELLLVCWCKRPNKEVACHGDIIKQAIEWLDRWERGIPEPQAHSLIHDLPSSVELPVEQLSFCEHLTMSTEATSAPEEISDELAETAIGWNAPVVLQNREATVPVQQSVDGTPAQLMQDDIQPCLPSVVEHSPPPRKPVRRVRSKSAKAKRRQPEPLPQLPLPS